MRSSFIRGSFLPETQHPYTLISPSTTRPLTTIYHASPHHVSESASSASRFVFESTWMHQHAFRRSVLLQIAQAIETHHESLSRLESENVGKPIKEARVDVSDVVEVFKYFAGFADKIHGRTHGCIMSGVKGYSLRQPVGVCGVITSYNYPLVLAAWKIAPALACGNAVIVKPHHLTPLSTLYLAHLCQTETDLPKDALAVLPGFADVGEAIVKSEFVDKISFTGSGVVGKKVMQACAGDKLKRITLELGGKSPMIVFPDADLEKAVEDVTGAIFTNMGQNCCAGSRLYLHESIHDAFLEKLKERIEKIRIGDPLSEDTDFGPIVDKVQYTKILAFIQRAKDSGLSVLTGGNATLNDGYFIQPTVFYNVDDASPIACEEVFGPVLTILKPFKTESEALHRANATPYGLASGIWTRDVDIVDRMTAKLRSGTVWVNCYNFIHPSLPFAGVKESGVGYDLGEEAVVNEYTCVKAVIQRSSLA